MDELNDTNLVADFTGYVAFFIAPSLYTLPMRKLYAKEKDSAENLQSKIAVQP